MTAQEVCNAILKSYQNYYDINTENPTAPFAAEAVFRSHDQQYFLIKKATISEAESNEFVFFAVCDQLDADTLRRLDQAAWSEGLSRVQPHKNHRNTDITLIVIAESIPRELVPTIKHLHHYKSYRLGLMGWSNFRIITLDRAFSCLTYNRQGKALKKTFRSIMKNLEKKED